MDAVKDVLDSVRSYVRDRLSNPLYAAFLVAWATINFRLLLVLVGDGNWRTKINYIDSSLYVSTWDWAIYGYLLPLFVAAIYVFVTPDLQRIVSIYIKRREIRSTKQLLEITKEEPLPQPAADALRRSLFAAKESHAAETQKLTAQLDELNQQIRVLQESNSELKKKNLTYESTINDLRLLNQSESSTSTVNEVSDFISKLSEKRSVTKLSGTQERFQIRVEDIVGAAKSQVDKLTSVGLNFDEVNALYHIRNLEEFYPDTFRSILQSPDMHSAEVILDRLKGFSLIQDTGRDVNQMAISSIGRQVLQALLNRGFKPEEEY